MSPRIIAFGELLWDLLPSGAVLGGAPANFALRAQSVGCDVSLISRLGIDTYGEQALALLKELGLVTSFLQCDDHRPTGTVNVTLTSEGNASYLIVEEVAYDGIEFTKELVALAPSTDLICFGTLVQRSAISRSTLYSLLELCSGAVKLVDINLRKACYTAETIQKSLELATILKLNAEEVPLVCTTLGLHDMSIEKFCGYVIETFSLTHVLVTRGSEGVYALAATGEIVDLPGHKVSVVDTIGSGDAFTAGFVGGLLTGVPFAKSCDLGNRLGAAVATKKGGMSYCPLDEALLL
jgi:fructokinase